MKKRLVVYFLLALIANAASAQIRTIKWWQEHGDFPAEEAVLNNLMENSATSVLPHLKKVVDNMRSGSVQTQSHNKDIIACINTIDEQLKKMALAGFPSKTQTGTSLINEYISSELSNYCLSLSSLNEELKSLRSEKGSDYSVFSIQLFFTAYYNFILSHSQLIAAISSLKRFYYLSLTNEAVLHNTTEIDSRQKHISDSVRLIFDTSTKSLSGITATVANTDTLLTKSFSPYWTIQNKEWKKKISSNGSDKIATGINTVLIDNRKNWWWRALLTGVAGGIVAGLIISNK